MKQANLARIAHAQEVIAKLEAVAAQTMEQAIADRYRKAAEVQRQALEAMRRNA